MNSLNFNLNAKIWLYLGLCVAAAAGTLYHFYTSAYSEYHKEIQKLDRDTQKKKGELRQILAQKQRLTDLEKEIERANSEFASLQDMFPDEEVIPRRLIDLTAVTRRSLTQPTRFLPMRVEEKEFYRENHYSVTISSSYHSLGALFSEVANFKYPTSISKLQIVASPELDQELIYGREHGQIAKTVIANFQLTTFTSKK